MEFSKKISPLEYLKNYISLFLIFFFMNSLLLAKAEDHTNLAKSRQEENKLNEFYSQNPITYSQHDKLESQLKMFFGYDSENPETSFYPDLSLIDDSEIIRNLYELKLNDITINKNNL